MGKDNGCAHLTLQCMAVSLTEKNSAKGVAHLYRKKECGTLNQANKLHLIFKRTIRIDNSIDSYIIKTLSVRIKSQMFSSVAIKSYFFQEISLYQDTKCRLFLLILMIKKRSKAVLQKFPYLIFS